MPALYKVENIQGPLLNCNSVCACIPCVYLCTCRLCICVCIVNAVYYCMYCVCCVNGSVGGIIVCMLMCISVRLCCVFV